MRRWISSSPNDVWAEESGEGYSEEEGGMDGCENLLRTVLVYYTSR